MHFLAAKFASVNATLGSFYISEVYHLEMPATEIVTVLKTILFVLLHPWKPSQSHLMILRQAFS
jgi:hypothetical protein